MYKIVFSLFLLTIVIIASQPTHAQQAATPGITIATAGKVRSCSNPQLFDIHDALLSQCAFNCQIQFGNSATPGLSALTCERVPFCPDGPLCEASCLCYL